MNATESKQFSNIAAQTKSPADVWRGQWEENGLLRTQCAG